MVLGAAAAALGMTAVFGSETRAQDEVSVEIVSVDAAGTEPLTASNTAPASSDDAATIAFEAGGDTSDPQVWIRHRTDRTSRPVAEERSRAPGISGNGCVVAYSTVGDDFTELRVTDICTTDGTADTDQPVPLAALVDSIPTVPEAAGSANQPIVAAPALSVDGGVLVWSTGDVVRRYVRSEPGRSYDLSDEFDATATPTQGSVTGVDVDVSADGSTIVFVAGPGAPYGPTPANIHVWDHRTATAPALLETVSVTSTGAPGSADSMSPSVSADGSLIVFESMSLDLLAATGATRPPTPFVAAEDRVDPDDRTTEVLVADASRPSVSADGRHVVYERGDALHVLSSSADGDFAADRALAGLQAVAPTTRAAISATGRWVVFDATTAPGGAASEFATGTQVWAANLQPPTDPPTTSGPTPNSTVPTTTLDSGTSLPATTVPGTWLDTPPVGPTITAPRPRFSIPTPRSTRSTTRSTTGRRSTFPLSGEDTTLSANSIVFPSTVIDAGRRTDTVVLSNPTSRRVSLVGTTIAPPGPFSIVEDACSGVLGAGSSCVVQVQFAPVTVGPVTASLVFQLADLPAVVATLDGDGSSEPTIDVVPAVAGAGQTVTVFGSGFPAGSSVQFVREELHGSESLIVDVDGTFARVVVVVPNTPSGPTTWSIEAQPDLFADSSTQLLVSNRRASAGGAALRGTLTGR